MGHIETELSIRDSEFVSYWRPFKFVAHLPLHTHVPVCDAAKTWARLPSEAMLYPFDLPEQQ